MALPYHTVDSDGIQLVDLRATFGERFKIAREPAHPRTSSDDPWLLVVPCLHGELYPHGGTYLAAYTYCRGHVSNQLASLPNVTVIQNGSDGITAVFDVEDFDVVATVMKPRRRRTLSANHRDALTAASQPSRFSKKHGNGKPPAEAA